MLVTHPQWSLVHMMLAHEGSQLFMDIKIEIEVVKQLGKDPHLSLSLQKLILVDAKLGNPKFAKL